MKKRYIIALGLMFLIYMSACGSYINEGVAGNKIYLYGTFDFLIVSAVMMAVPLFLKLSNKINEENGKKICRNNSLIIFVLSLLVIVMSGSSSYFGIGGLGAIFYYFINMNLFVQETNQITSSKKNIENSTSLTANENNGDNDKWQEHLEKNYKATGTRTDMRMLKYSDNINYKSIFLVTIIVLTIVLIISLVFNINQYLENKKLGHEYSDLLDYYDKKSDELFNERLKNAELNTKVNFFDNYIVIIPKDSNYYMSYDCWNKKGRSENFYMMNYIEAQNRGYLKYTCSIRDNLGIE